MKTDDVRKYFCKDSLYVVKRTTKTGFQRDSEIQAGTKVRFRHFQYSHYDGCFACHFENLDTNQSLELWIQEEATNRELDEIFEPVK